MSLLTDVANRDRRDMTTLAADLISLRSPAALCCAIPHLLGFHPSDSAVILWMHGGRILLTQRIDLPEKHELAEWSAAVWGHQAAEIADEMVVALVSDRADDPRLDKAFAAITARADGLGITIRDGLHLNGDRWRSLLCRDANCCPSEGRPIDPDLRAMVAAEFAAEAAPPASSRDCIIDSLNPDPAAVDAVLKTGILSRLHRPRRREAWRDSCLTNMGHWWRAEAQVAPPVRMAQLLLGLRDIRVRDTVLWELCHLDGAGLRRAKTQLLRLLRSAPEGDVAPIATCVGIASWLNGDGVRAMAAVVRALQDDPHYEMGRMLGAAVAAGLPPEHFREALGGLSREDCRYGVASPAA